MSINNSVLKQNLSRSCLWPRVFTQNFPPNPYLTTITSHWAPPEAKLELFMIIQGPSLISQDGRSGSHYYTCKVERQSTGCQLRFSMDPDKPLWLPAQRLGTQSPIWQVLLVSYPWPDSCSRKETWTSRWILGVRT